MKTAKQSAVHVKERKPVYVRKFRAVAQHATHPLHLYCRLADAGAGKARARIVCAQYERLVYKPIFGALLLAVFLTLSACTSTPVYKPVDVMVPVTVPCKAPEIEKPKWPFQNLTPEASIFEKTKMALVEIELRKGYEAQLEAATGACL